MMLMSCNSASCGNRVFAGDHNFTYMVIALVYITVISGVSRIHSHGVKRSKRLKSLLMTNVPFPYLGP